MSFVEKIYEAGVVGAGGAGFPTHVKYKGSVKTLLINGAECEPLLHTDKFQMEHFSREILLAIVEAKEALEAERAVLALKEKYVDIVARFKGLIEETGAPVEIFTMDNFYPAGDEQITIYEAFKKAVPAGGIPLQVDVVVSNVATMKSVHDAQAGIPVTEKYVTVTGEVREPVILKVPIGITVAECIEAAGGTALSAYWVIVGGPMMGHFLTPEEADITVVRKTTGGIIVVPKDHTLVQRGTKSLQAIKNETRAACIQCTFCTEYCPRYLIGHPLHPHKIMRAFGVNDTYDARFLEANLCCECGICELFACPMAISPRIVNVFLKKELRKNGITGSFENGPVLEERAYRYVPVDRLLSRLDIRGYAEQGKLPVKDQGTDRVVIPMSQHIGKPATPVVAVGDRVKAGDLIGDIPLGELGARVHASLSGVVTMVGEAVVIETEERRREG